MTDQPMTEHAHKFPVDASCECGIMLSAFTRELARDLELMIHNRDEWRANCNENAERIERYASDKAALEAQVVKLKDELDYEHTVSIPAAGEHLERERDEYKQQVDDIALALSDVRVDQDESGSDAIVRLVSEKAALQQVVATWKDIHDALIDVLEGRVTLLDHSLIHVCREKMQEQAALKARILELQAEIENLIHAFNNAVDDRAHAWARVKELESDFDNLARRPNQEVARLVAHRDRLRALLMLAYDQLNWNVDISGDDRIAFLHKIADAVSPASQVTAEDIAWAREQLSKNGAE